MEDDDFGLDDFGDIFAPGTVARAQLWIVLGSAAWLAAVFYGVRNT